MAQYKIVGYERNKGVKKSGQAYDWHVIHAVSERPLRGTGKLGYAVLTQMIAESDGILQKIPEYGEIWEFSYDSRGRLDDAYPVDFPVE